eukprot:COSAG01_NODE_5572_length_4152_cov_4.827036_2_plen_260_part_00
MHACVYAGCPGAEGRRPSSALERTHCELLSAEPLRPGSAADERRRGGAAWRVGPGAYEQPRWPDWEGGGLEQPRRQCRAKQLPRKQRMALQGRASSTTNRPASAHGYSRPAAARHRASSASGGGGGGGGGGRNQPAATGRPSSAPADWRSESDHALVGKPLSRAAQKKVVERLYQPAKGQGKGRGAEEEKEEQEEPSWRVHVGEQHGRAQLTETLARPATDKTRRATRLPQPTRTSSRWATPPGCWTTAARCPTKSASR